MAMIIENDGKQYLITIDKPEKEWVTLISSALGMNNNAVIGAALNKGLLHYVEMLQEITTHETRQHEANDNEH